MRAFRIHSSAANKSPVVPFCQRGYRGFRGQGDKCASRMSGSYQSVGLRFDLSTGSNASWFIDSVFDIMKITENIYYLDGLILDSYEIPKELKYYYIMHMITTQTRGVSCFQAQK